ncbi:hypothetical protein MKEN_00010400 [Mycena kentingensis (nom. inval.)]|nr:hypothetical protein MKEN_00010400 [Mycena kentingensis (nom. inval.)]
MSSVDFGSFYHGTDEEDELARIDAEDIHAPSPDYSGAELDRHDESYESQYPLVPASEDNSSVEGTLQCLQCRNPPVPAELTRCRECGADSHTACLGFSIPNNKPKIYFVCGNCLEPEPPRANNLARRTRAPKTLYMIPTRRKPSQSTVWLPAQLISHHRSRVGGEYEFAWVTGAVNPHSGKPVMKQNPALWPAEQLDGFPETLTEMQLGLIELPCALKTDAELAEAPIATQLHKVCLKAIPQIEAILDAKNSANRVVANYDEYFRTHASQSPPPSDADWLKAVRLAPSTAAKSVLEPIVHGIATRRRAANPFERPQRTRSICYVLFQCLGIQHAVGEVFELGGHTFDLWRSGVIVAQEYRTAVQALDLMTGVVDTVRRTVEFEAQRQERARVRRLHTKWIMPDQFMLVRKLRDFPPSPSGVGELIIVDGEPLRWVRDLERVRVEQDAGEPKPKPKPKPKFKVQGG